MEVRCTQLNGSLRLTILSVASFVCRLSIRSGVRTTTVKAQSYLTMSQCVNACVELNGFLMHNETWVVHDEKHFLGSSIHVSTFKRNEGQNLHSGRDWFVCHSRPDYSCALTTPARAFGWLHNVVLTCTHGCRQGHFGPFHLHVEGSGARLFRSGQAHASQACPLPRTNHAFIAPLNTVLA